MGRFLLHLRDQLALYLDIVCLQGIEFLRVLKNKFIRVTIKSKKNKGKKAIK